MVERDVVLFLCVDTMWFISPIVAVLIKCVARATKRRFVYAVGKVKVFFVTFAE